MFADIVKKDATEIIISEAQKSAEDYIEDLRRSIKDLSSQEKTCLMAAKQTQTLDFARLVSLKNRANSYQSLLETALELYEKLFGNTTLQGEI